MNSLINAMKNLRTLNAMRPPRPILHEKVQPKNSSTAFLSKTGPILRGYVLGLAGEIIRYFANFGASAGLGPELAISLA